MFPNLQKYCIWSPEEIINTTWYTSSHWKYWSRFHHWHNLTHQRAQLQNIYHKFHQENILTTKGGKLVLFPTMPCMQHYTKLWDIQGQSGTVPWKSLKKQKGKNLHVYKIQHMRSNRADLQTWAWYWLSIITEFQNMSNYSLT